MELSREELLKHTAQSIDPVPLGAITRPYDNVDLTDEELCCRIEKRNKEGKSTFLLRAEYDRRLRQRGL